MTTGDQVLGSAAKEKIDGYIARFAAEVAQATGAHIDFPPLDQDGFTAVTRGSATVGITLFPEEGVVLFISRVMPVPTRDAEACFRLLLELNFTATSDAAFAIDKAADVVCVRAQRSVDTLDYEEFVETLTAVAATADDWDDKLIAQFT